MRYMAITVLALLVAAVAFASNVDVDINAPNTPPGPPGPVWQGPDNLVLWNNGPLITGTCPNNVPPGDESMADPTKPAGYNISQSANARMADDFVVPAGQQWMVQAITHFQYQTGGTTGTSPINHINMQVWDAAGPPNGTVLCGDYTTNLLVFSAWSGIYRAFDTGGCPTNRPIHASLITPPADCPDCPGFPGTLLLGPGQYWLDWQVGGTLASGPWQPMVTPNGSGPDPSNNARQYFGNVWTTNLSSGPEELPFIIDGDFCGVTPVEASTWGAIKSTLR